MALNSKKAAYLILVITALVFSRALFALFNDPEGPNLLIVTVAAAFIYLLSLAAYAFGSSIESLKRLLLAACVQLLVLAGLYFLLS